MKYVAKSANKYSVTRTTTATNTFAQNSGIVPIQNNTIPPRRFNKNGYYLAGRIYNIYTVI